MEHSKVIEDISDINIIKYVGYKPGLPEKELFSPKNTKIISAKITELLEGVDPKGRKILISDKTINFVMSNLYTNFVPRDTGNIHSRYIIPDYDVPPGYQDIIDQTIEIIVEDVKNDIGITENNRKLSIWNTVGGDFNPHGLRHHPPIKINHKKPRSSISMMY